MICPLCKTENEEKATKKEWSGVLGGKNHSVVKNLDYYICKDCGIHYSEVSK